MLFHLKHILRLFTGAGLFTLNDLNLTILQFTAVFNNMRTLKFKPQPTDAFFAAVNQISGGFRLLPSVALTWKGESVVMADEAAVRSFTTQSPATQLQSFSEDSVFEDVSIELPDLEETQIVDNEEDQVSVI